MHKFRWIKTSFFILFTQLLPSLTLAGADWFGELKVIRGSFLQEKLSVTPFIDVTTLNYKFSQIDHTNGKAEQSADYAPNAGFSVGFGLKYKDYGGSISFPVQPAAKEIEKKGNTDHFDIVLFKCWKWGGADLFLQSYKGFYRSDRENKNSEQSYFKRPDVNAINIGLNTYYLFAPESYQMEWGETHQNTGTKHSGSAIASTSINHFRINGSNSLLGDETHFSPDKSESMNKGEFTTLSLAGGYGYQFDFDATRMRSLLLVGLGPQWQTIESKNGEKKRMQLAQKVLLNMSFEHQLELIRFGMDIKFDEIGSDVGGVKFSSNATSAVIYVRSDI